MAASGLQGLLAATVDDPELESQLRAPGADPVAIAAEPGVETVQVDGKTVPRFRLLEHVALD